MDAITTNAVGYDRVDGIEAGSMRRSKGSTDAVVERYLGSLEAEIMRVLWDKPRLPVRSVVELLPGRRARAYTTVMTVMNRLFEKGLLQREAAGRLMP